MLPAATFLVQPVTFTSGCCATGRVLFGTAAVNPKELGLPGAAAGELKPEVLGDALGYGVLRTRGRN